MQHEVKNGKLYKVNKFLREYTFVAELPEDYRDYEDCCKCDNFIIFVKRNKPPLKFDLNTGLFVTLEVNINESININRQV